ncbi:energy transducer TonB [Rectinema subterraneum]|jgi:TonB family protein|uniref:energy transducer TonB n=1 Tax=Rectinema subterraneum TaxID=2653714 RepID=UPI00131B0476|nr:energy transducer TonB [Rectinema subterraneum]
MRQRRNQLFVYRAAGLALSLAIHALIIFAPIGMRAVRQPFVVSLNIDELREADVLSREAPKVIQDPVGQVKQVKQDKQETALKQTEVPEATQQPFEKEAVLPQAEAPEIHIPDIPAAAEAIEAKESLQEPLSAQAEIAREIPGPSALEEAPAPARAMSEMPIEASATLPAAPAVPIEAPAVPIAESEVQQFAPAEPPAKPAPQAAQAFAQAAPQAARSTEPTLSDVPVDALQPTPSQALSVPQAEKPLPAKPKLALSREGLASSLIALPQSISGDVPAGQKQAKGAISRSSVSAAQSSAPSSAAIAPQEGVFHDDAEEIRAEHVNDFLAKRKSGSPAAFQGEQQPESALVPASLHESQLQPIAQGSAEASSAGSLEARAEGSASLTNQRAIQNDFGSANAVVEVREQSRADGALARSDASEPSGIDAPESPKSTVSASDLDAESPLILEKPLERDPLEPARTESVQTEPAWSKSASMESAPATYDTVESLAAAIAGKLAAQKQYPAAALKRKSEGTVRIALQVAPDGTLASLAIQSRSGSAILDEAALQLVRSIFPLHIRLETAVSLLIPVEYRIPR